MRFCPAFGYGQVPLKDIHLSNSANIWAAILFFGGLWPVRLAPPCRYQLRKMETAISAGDFAPISDLRPAYPGYLVQHLFLFCQPFYTAGMNVYCPDWPIKYVRRQGRNQRILINFSGHE